ncbi:MAG TPA: hypothetical protein VFP91_11535 [Vicinamibacterales bacterium]|nr:hypothetical protein [Vicinamibacterales bacterium]
MADLVQTPIWKWVVDVYKTRALSVDVVDEHLNVLPPPLRPGSTSAVDPLVVEAVRYLAPALNEGHGETASLRERRFCTMPFVASGSVAGAALVGGDREQGRDEELQRAAALLSRVLEDCLSPPDAPRPTSRRLAALYDLLNDARGTASEPQVFQVFAEIVNVWDDAEVFGYRADLSGQYALAASLPGSDRSTVPDFIAADAVPPAHVVNLTASMQRQLGFADARYPILIGLSTNGGPWLIAATHRPGSQQLPEWFDFYLAALTESLNASLENEVARATSGIMQQLVEHDSPRHALSHAIRVVADTLSADGSFTMWEADGTVAFSIGEVSPETSGDLRGADVLRVRISGAAGRHARFEMRPRTANQFSRRDVKLFDAATWTLSRWFSTSAEQLAAPREPSATAQSFDEVVERSLRAGRRAGTAALILIMPVHPDAPIDLAYEWIGRVRSQLRPTDLAGRLTTGEVAVIAVETSQPGALVVARRIARVLNDSVDAVHKRVRVGLAAASGASVSALGLIAEARRHLVADA